MSKDLISKKTRQEFREALVNWWVLRTISQEFDAEDIECVLDFQPNLAGQRRSLVEQYYKSLDFTQLSDVKKLLRVYENVLNTLVSKDTATVERLQLLLQRDGFNYENGRIETISHNLPTLEQAKEVATEFNAAYMANQIRRINDSIDNDPDLAVGSSKELLETCCKTILIDRSVELPENADVPKLVKLTMEVLKLLPENVPDTAKGSEAIKRLLGNLSGVARGLIEIRNLYGSGHGQYGRTTSLKPRHAKLAVGAATTLVVFLFETHRETIQTSELDHS